MRRVYGPALFGAGLVLLSLGCTSSKDREYPQTAREGFMASCLEAAREKLAEGPGASGKNTEEQARAYCECSLKKIMVRIPYDEFAKFDKAIRAQEAIDPVTQKKLQDTVSECQEQAAAGK